MPVFPRPTRCLDTGLRSAAENHAIDRLWLQDHAAGKRPATLRFHRSRPAASVGLHQAIDRELRLDYCRTRGIEVLRRASGGGALYLDEDQFCFSLVAARPAHATLGDLLRHGCEAVARALAALGITAHYKFPNDLEVDGGKVASVFVAVEDGAMLLHGTVLLDTDIKTMLEALRAPTEKLSADGLTAARERLATIRQCLGPAAPPAALGRALRQGLATAFEATLEDAEAGAPDRLPTAQALDRERRHASDIDWSTSHQPWVEALWKTPGATLRMRARFTADEQRFTALEMSGDLICEPPALFRAVTDSLAGVPLGLAERCLQEALRPHPFHAVGVGAADLGHLVHLLADKQRMRHQLDVTDAQANAVMAFSPGLPLAMRDILGRASVMLVPYCAKPGWCKWRHLDGCTECGLCEVGTAYRLARERGLRVVTVTNYEHLVATLAHMKDHGAQAYVGMCCSNFYLKRHRAFTEAGMPAVLMDISGANCYELRQEDQAYAGRFTAEAKLDAELLVKVMKFVPPRG